MNKVRRSLILWAVLFAITGIFSKQAMAQIVSADRLRSNDTGANGQFWERTEDSQNTMRWVYGPLDNSGTVDINNPLYNRYRITGRGSAIWVGRNDLGADPALPTGAGNRMMWYPFKGAFRVGGVDDSRWDDVSPFGGTNIGQYSVGVGFNTLAKGNNSIAMGTYSVATGLASVALGSAVWAEAEGAISIGSVNPGLTLLPLRNNIPYSLMVGFKSELATLFVGPAPGYNNTGSVGIATTNTQGYKLFVNGSVAATSYTQISDIRLKTNIRSIDNPLEKVLKLQGIKYEWNKDASSCELTLPAGAYVGFSAQDVENVLPEVVSTSTEGYKTVSYQSITPVLVEAMKEQQKIIEEVKVQYEIRLSQQQSKLDQQQAEIDQLKAQLQAVIEKLTDAGGKNK
ncbi:MAG: tail fiber domain-containing protein [Acidobacteriota bacterium]